MGDEPEIIYANVSRNWTNHLKINSWKGLFPVKLSMSSKSMSIYTEQNKMIIYLSYAEFEITSYANTNTIICNVILYLQEVEYEI